MTEAELTEAMMPELLRVCRRVGKRYEIDPDELLGAAWLGMREAAAIHRPERGSLGALVAVVARRRAIEEARRLKKRSPVVDVNRAARDCADECADAEILERAEELIPGKDRRLWAYVCGGGDVRAYGDWRRSRRRIDHCRYRLRCLRAKLAAMWPRLTGDAV